MPSTHHARQSLFTGLVAWQENNNVTPVARHSFFTGYVAENSSVFISKPDAKFNLFVGYVAEQSAAFTSTPRARMSLFVNTLSSPAPITSSGGYVLYPISEDPAQRPTLRY
jgi:hypothetical protein